MGFLEDAKKKAMELANAAAATAGDLYEKGKDKVQEVQLENELAKAQKQLGALTYSLYKAGNLNGDLIASYVLEIENIEAKIEKLKEDSSAECKDECGCGCEDDKACTDEKCDCTDEKCDCGDTDCGCAPDAPGEDGANKF